MIDLLLPLTNHGGVRAGPERRGPLDRRAARARHLRGETGRDAAAGHAGVLHRHRAPSGQRQHHEDALLRAALLEPQAGRGDWERGAAPDPPMGPPATAY